jgi:hypothetical protein
MHIELLLNANSSLPLSLPLLYSSGLFRSISMKTQIQDQQKQFKQNESTRPTSTPAAQRNPGHVKTQMKEEAMDMY